MRGLVISWFYPPVNSSEGLVTFKLLKRSDIKHDVFTQNENKIWSYNNSENELVDKNIKTIFGSSESFEKWMTDCLEYFDKNYKKYDFIMSRSMPPESHRAALMIKQKYPNIKWIASFGDPIYNSPYTHICKEKSPHKLDKNLLNNSFRKLASPKRFAKSLLWDFQDRHFIRDEKSKKEIEDETIKSADALIFNNDYQKQFMVGKKPDYIANKSFVIPHTFDKSLYHKHTSSLSDKITISYVGHLDYLRSPLNFLKALKKLRDSYPEKYNKLYIPFYGNMDNASKIYILENQLYDIVKIQKPVKYIESLSIMSQSDWCLLIDANISSLLNENIYFAAKIADYIGSGTNIFAISMTNGASADIIRETNGILCSHSVDEIFMYLNYITEKRINKKQKHIEQFNNVNASKKYDKIVNDLIGKK